MDFGSLQEHNLEALVLFIHVISKQEKQAT